MVRYVQDAQTPRSSGRQGDDAVSTVESFEPYRGHASNILPRAIHTGFVAVGTVGAEAEMTPRIVGGYWQEGRVLRSR